MFEFKGFVPRYQNFVCNKCHKNKVNSVFPSFPKMGNFKFLGFVFMSWKVFDIFDFGNFTRSKIFFPYKTKLKNLSFSDLPFIGKFEKNGFVHTLNGINNV